MSNDQEYIEIKAVTGFRILVPKNHVIGYCHFPGHKGGITKKVLKDHECLKKNCTFFEKYTDLPYWKEHEKREKARQKRKNYVRLKKAERAEIQRQNDMFTQQTYETAQNILEEMEYNLKILNIKKVPNSRKCIVIYISKHPYNDWYQYLDFARAFGDIIGYYVELKHAKDVDGTYASY